METWRQYWTKEKNEIALRLHNGECGGSYGESVIILCAVISALSADVWPGRNIDRVRFVELLKKFASSELAVDKISTPLLIAKLQGDNKINECDKLKKGLLNVDYSLVVTGNDVDKYENEILKACDSLSLKEIREQSYANILYTEIRSGYAHEYRPGKRADSWPMTREETTISYINWADRPNRNIHFHVQWLSNVALSVAKAIDEIDNKIPLEIPNKWWVHG
ncbi:MAG: hypothetical protein AB2826_10945 [Candidatus Thiodiazotropha sp.]